MRKKGKKKKVKYKGGIESNKKGHMIMSRQRAKHLYSDKSTGFMALCLPIFFYMQKTTINKATLQIILATLISF